MATNTTNLNLIKPAGSERVQISQINQNMDILDEKIGAVGNTSLQGQITNLGNRIDTEVSSKQYNLGQLTSDTLANQIYAFANAHRQMNGYTGAFYLSATAIPSDLPAQTNEWKYAHGHFHIRHSNATGVADGEIVLYGFNTNRIAIKNMANNVVTDNWAIINGAYTFSNASDLYSFVTELNSYVSSMVMYDSRNVAVEFTAASSPFTSARYIGTLTKTSDSRAQLTLHQHNAQVIIYGIQNGTTWQWDSYALSSQITPSSIITNGIATAGSGISITTQQAVVTASTITIRIVCKKTDNSAFTGRMSPLFTIASAYKPKMALNTVCVTSQTPGSYMTGYALAYTNIEGTTVVDIPTGITDQKEITFSTTYMRG